MLVLAALLLPTLLLQPVTAASGARGRREAVACEVCGFLVDHLDESVRRALPDAPMVEAGWRLLESGKRERSMIPEPQTELWLHRELKRSCRQQHTGSAYSDKLGASATQQERQQYSDGCKTFVEEWESELMAIKDWKRVKLMQRGGLGEEKTATYMTPSFDDLKVELCRSQTRACRGETLPTGFKQREAADSAGPSKTKNAKKKKQAKKAKKKKRSER